QTFRSETPYGILGDRTHTCLQGSHRPPSSADCRPLYSSTLGRILRNGKIFRVRDRVWRRHRRDRLPGHGRAPSSCWCRSISQQNFDSELRSSPSASPPQYLLATSHDRERDYFTL